MILPVEAHPVAAGERADAFDLLRVPHPASVLRSKDGEHVIIADGPRCIRLDVVAGSLLGGPVRLGYRLSGFADVEAKALTLRRLLALKRLGRLPRSLFPPERKAARWALALQAYDGARAGASQREIASVLFGSSIVRADWNGSSHLRTRIQRLVQAAGRMISGGYRDLLR